MPKQPNRKRVIGVGVLTAALLALLFAASASAKPTGLFTRLQFCDYANAEVERCLHSVTEGGSVALGNKRVPIVNPVILQGGLTEPSLQGPEENFSKFVEPTNGETLSRASQPIPGGLAGLVNCSEAANLILRISCMALFENGFTGANAVLELARPASEIRVSNEHFGEQIGVAFKLPVKIKLENPFLGESCHIGSASRPVEWELTTGRTSSTGSTRPIAGSVGEFNFLENGEVLEVAGAQLVDNAWLAPAASGCGGIFSFVIDPIINSSSGLPSPAGKNTAILENTITQAIASAVKKNDEQDS